MTADLALIASDAGALEAAADPAQFVVLACQRAKEWLAQAVEHGEIDQIVELKSQAEAVRVYTAQKQLGKDAELAAAEIVRRAERGIGRAIRKGQEAGQIRKHGDDTRTDLADRVVSNNLVSPAEAAQVNNRSDLHQIYAITDGVSDERFDDAIEQAKAEQNLSRANVVRKVRGQAGPTTAAEKRAAIAELAAQALPSRQIAERLGLSETYVRRAGRTYGIEIPADQIFNRTRRTDSTRFVRETAHALEGLAIGVELVDLDDLDRAGLRGWATSLTNSMRVLNRFVKQIKEIAQ